MADKDVAFPETKLTNGSKKGFCTDDISDALCYRDCASKPGYQGKKKVLRKEKKFSVLLFQVHLISHFILNGVCVRWRGVVDLDRLDGTGCLEFDEPTAQLEEALLKEEIQQYNQRMQSFEERFHPGLIEQDR